MEICYRFLQEGKGKPAVVTEGVFSGAESLILICLEVFVIVGSCLLYSFRL